MLSWQFFNYKPIFCRLTKVKKQNKILFITYAIIPDFVEETVLQPCRSPANRFRPVVIKHYHVKCLPDDCPV